MNLNVRRVGGFSTGLIYAPGCFAELDEIVELAKEVAQKGGVYASHIRNERKNVEEADEVKANSTYLKPRELSTGVVHLWVNGNWKSFDPKRKNTGSNSWQDINT